MPKSNEIDIVANGLAAFSASEISVLQRTWMQSHSEAGEKYLTEDGARMLASRIQEFWRSLGYKGAAAWTEPGVKGDKSYYVVRSNLRCGIPPGGRSVL